MAEKKGKLFVKDSNGSVVQIIPEAVAVIPDYQGATTTTAGVSGLVPAALSTQTEKYLRGDGTWQDACVPTGVCNCTYAHVRRTFHAGVNICDGDGSWLSTAITLDASIYPDEVRLYHVNFRFGADGPGGCAYWLPYNTTAPQSMEERTYEFYRDSTIFQRNNSNHFIQTFSNGFSMDSWIEVDTEQSGYHYLYIRVYGPTAQDIPRAVPLNVDGTDVFLTQNLTAGQSADIPVSGTTIKLYPRPTHRTALYRNEFYEYSGAAGFEPVEITSTEYTPPYLSYTAVRTSTGIRITANNVNINDWPQELSSVSLSLTSGSTTNVVDMNCLPYWVSTQLTKIDERIAAVNTRVNNIGIYQGATENESGVIGLVPAATSAEKDKFLRGDGTWSDIEVMSENDVNDVYYSVFGHPKLTIPNDGFIKFALAKTGGGCAGYVSNDHVWTTKNVVLESDTEYTFENICVPSDILSRPVAGLCISVLGVDDNGDRHYYSTMGNLLQKFSASEFESWENGITDELKEMLNGPSVLIMPQDEQYVYTTTFWNYLAYDRTTTPLLTAGNSVTYYLNYKGLSETDKNGDFVPGRGFKATIARVGNQFNLVVSWDGTV